MVFAANVPADAVNYTDDRLLDGHTSCVSFNHTYCLSKRRGDNRLSIRALVAFALLSFTVIDWPHAAEPIGKSSNYFGILSSTDSFSTHISLSFTQCCEACSLRLINNSSSTSPLRTFHEQAGSTWIAHFAVRPHTSCEYLQAFADEP